MFSLVKMRLMLIVAFGCFLSTGYTQKRISSFKFEEMLVEYAENPINIDAKHPRFSWIISSPQRNQVQSAYQLMVATSAYLLSHNHPDLWNSGKVISNETIQHEYDDNNLRSNSTCYWKVVFWDGNGYRY